MMPTLKQITVAKDLSENVGKPLGQAMLDAGYSRSTSETPQRLTDSKGWAELMDEYLGDDVLAKKHQELLQDKGFIGVKALDMAYKVKGKYTEDKGDTYNQFNIGEINLETLDDKQLESFINAKATEVRVSQTLTREGETNEVKSSQVLQTTPQATSSNSQQQTNQSPILGQ